VTHRISHLIDWLNEWTGNVWVCLGVVAVVVADVLWGWSVGAFKQPDWGNLNGAATGFIGVILLFFLQHSTNRGNAAVQLKLDQLILATHTAPNTAVDSESLPEVEIKRMKAEAVDQVRGAVEEGVDDASHRA
jgi:low affinity Fe/Cu permease